MRFHFTNRGAMHKGDVATCSRCREQIKRRERYRLSRVGKVDGRTLNRKYPPKNCERCGIKVSGCNCTGFCKDCLLRYRAEQRAKRKEEWRLHGPRCKCGVVLGRYNKSGLCRDCYAAAGLHGRKTKPSTGV